MITLADAKAHLNVTTEDDDALISQKLAAAKILVGNYLGEPLVIIGDTMPTVVEAVLQLTAHFYENREAAVVGISAEQLPFGIVSLLAPMRRWSF